MESLRAAGDARDPDLDATPIELLLPLGAVGIVPWRGGGDVYLRSALYRGEFGSAYLGLAGVPLGIEPLLAELSGEPR